MKLAPLSAVTALVLALIFTAAGVPSAVGQQAPAKGPTYTDVAPVLEARCTMCHAGPKAAKGLRLDSYDDIMKTGDKVIIPGNPLKSTFFLRITGTQKPRMPKNGPPWLSEKETALIEQWIAAGVPK